MKNTKHIVSDKSVYLWVEQPLGAGIPEKERYFRVVFSGQPVPDDFEYVDTALDFFGPEAFHVFDVSLEAQRRDRVTAGFGLDVYEVRSRHYQHVGAA